MTAAMTNRTSRSQGRGGYVSADTPAPPSAAYVGRVSLRFRKPWMTATIIRCCDVCEYSGACIGGN